MAAKLAKLGEICVVSFSFFLPCWGNHEPMFRLALSLSLSLSLLEVKRTGHAPYPKCTFPLAQVGIRLLNRLAYSFV